MSYENLYTLMCAVRLCETAGLDCYTNPVSQERIHIHDVELVVEGKSIMMKFDTRNPSDYVEYILKPIVDNLGLGVAHIGECAVLGATLWHGNCLASPEYSDGRIIMYVVMDDVADIRLGILSIYVEKGIVVYSDEQDVNCFELFKKMLE